MPEWPKSIIFGPQHAPAGQKCLNWAPKAPRVSPAACHTLTCANMAKINHVWPTANPSRSVMPELGSKSTHSAYSCLPHTNMCQNNQIHSCLAHSMVQQVSHAWTDLLESTQRASSCLPHTNMCQIGQNQSCLAHSVPQQVSHAWTGLGQHPESLQLPQPHTYM